jgi:hypothetical protein
MNTASTEARFIRLCSAGAGKPNKYRTEPSDDEYLCFTVGKVTLATEDNFPRRAVGRLVMRAKSRFRSA